MSFTIGYKETKASLIAQYQQIEDAAKLDFEKIVAIVDVAIAKKWQNIS